MTTVVFAVAILGAACGNNNSPSGNTGTTGATTGATTGTTTGATTGATTGGGSGQTVKIEFMGALSGDYKLLVEGGYQAAQMAINDANKAGNLPVTIQLVPQDTQGDPTQASSLVNKFVTDNSVVGVIGPAFSGESGAVGDTLDQAGIPFVTQSATDDALATHGWTHWFRALGNNSSQAIPEAQYISKVLKPNCAVVAQDGSAYGKGLAQIANDQLTKDGVKVSSQEQIDPTSKDFSALVGKIQSSGCTALFYGGYSPQAGPIRKQMTTAGLTNVTMVGGDGIKDDTFPSLAGTAGEGTIAGCGCADVTTSTDPAAKAFVTEFTNTYHSPPGIYAAEGYDVAQIFISALKAGKTTRADITSYIAGLSGFKGLTKTYSFQKNGELSADAVETFFYKDTGGKWVIIGPATQVLPA
jgi:branched-chain amino acid transport system substrate-binding protein